MPQDPQIAALVRSKTAVLRRLRDFRRQFDTKRAGLYRQYVAQRDAQKFPDGITNRSNTFIPYPLSNVETITSKVSSAFFSFDPWFETNGRGANDDDAAEAMQHVLAYVIRKSNFYDAFEALVKNIAIYGHAGIKVDWDWDYDTVMSKQAILAPPQPVMDPQTGGPAMGPQGPVMQTPVDPNTGAPLIIGYQPITVQVPRNCPKFIPIDVYDLLVDPDGGIVAHLFERTLGQMKRENATYMAAHDGQPLYYPEGLAEIEQKLAREDNPDSITIRMAEVWDDCEQTCTVMTFGEDADAIAFKDTRAGYRASNYSAYKRKVFAGGPILLWHGPNTFLHKRNPVLSTSYIKMPNEVFGLGAIEVISDLTESFNKFINMIVDNWNVGINRRYAYDVNADIDHAALDNFNVPGGKVGVNGQPDKVIFPLPMFTPNQGDYAVLDVYKGMIEMSSGISDFYAKGMGAPTGNRTATGISQVIGESSDRFKLFIRNLEMDILQPLLEMCAANVQQFITAPIEVQITDSPSAIPNFALIPPAALIGNMNFNIVAANYATDKVVRQRNLMGFLNIAMQSPYFNPYEGLREVAKVLEIPHAQRLLYTEQQVQQMQAAQQAQQIQMMIFESMLNTESAARIQQSKPQPVGSGGAHGRTRPQGRPAKAQFEGKIPGAGLTGAIRSFAQQHGANALGLEGLSENG